MKSSQRTEKSQAHETRWCPPAARGERACTVNLTAAAALFAGGGDTYASRFISSQELLGANFLPIHGVSPWKRLYLVWQRRGLRAPRRRLLSRQMQSCAQRSLKAESGTNGPRASYFWRCRVHHLTEPPLRDASPVSQFSVSPRPPPFPPGGLRRGATELVETRQHQTMSK